MHATSLQKSVTQGTLLRRCIGGMSQVAEGQFVLAERFFSDVLAEVEQHGGAYIGIACMAGALLGEALYGLNDVDAACRLLDKRIDVLEHVSIPDTVLRAPIVLASAHWRAHVFSARTE
ncbi:ATP-dependent transcription regulator LuxR [Caballeronia arationis]|jgi:LuxR family maltose regulon positive regulatory protein|nr:ATP-dependent transcription regulator LuxR [Caballeronia arationis]